MPTPRLNRHAHRSGSDLALTRVTPGTTLKPDDEEHRTTEVGGERHTQADQTAGDHGSGSHQQRPGEKHRDDTQREISLTYTPTGIAG